MPPGDAARAAKNLGIEITPRDRYIVDERVMRQVMKMAVVEGWKGREGVLLNLGVECTECSTRYKVSEFPEPRPEMVRAMVDEMMGMIQLALANSGSQVKNSGVVLDSDGLPVN